MPATRGGVTAARGIAMPTVEPSSSPLPEGWSARTWNHASVEKVYDAILGHPFLRGLADGTLPEETFRHYLAQVRLAACWEPNVRVRP